jgi:hypothetical protein
MLQSFTIISAKSGRILGNGYMQCSMRPASLAGSNPVSLGPLYQVVHHLGPRWTALTNIPDDCLTGKAPLRSCILNAEPPEFPSIDRETVIRIDEGIRAKGYSELAAKIKSELEKLVVEAK